MGVHEHRVGRSVALGRREVGPGGQHADTELVSSAQHHLDSLLVHSLVWATQNVFDSHL